MATAAAAATPEEAAVRKGPEPEPEPTVESRMRISPGDDTALRAGDFVSYQGRLFGTLQEYMSDRERWALQLADGRVCAAKAEQLERTPFEPFARVEVVGDDCGPLLGMCGEITGYLPERGRWTLKLDVGRNTAARTDQLRLTDKPKPEEGEDGEHSCSCSGSKEPADGEHPENCLDGGDTPQLPGLSEADQALVSLVAKDGAAAEDWDKKSFQLHAAALAAAKDKQEAAAATGEEAQQTEEVATRTGAELAARWAEIAPVRTRTARKRPFLPCPLDPHPRTDELTRTGRWLLSVAAGGTPGYQPRDAMWPHLRRLPYEVDLPPPRRD
jgi:hypothetical protein